ncbi:MAG: helix-turn-helix domain-containing protein [Lawsonibacter sp.]|jgi:transcriptional regulator with XRE-family HTH domain|nr:helix-turn-helix domain-containing protein [Lawsonibacter sp.]
MELKQMELKEKLVDLRKEKGLSQAELAEAINVSRQAISRWEVGTAIPSADNLMWLSKFYEVSMDELMGVDTDDNQPAQKEQQITSKEPVFSKKIAIILCVIVVFIGVAAWIIFSINKSRENSETPPVSIGELDSYDVGSLDREDGEFGKE